MHAIWKMNRRRLFFATAGGKALSLLAKPQLGAYSKGEQATAVDGISWNTRSLVARTRYCCRSFTAASIETSQAESTETSKDGISSKLTRVLAACEGKVWNTDLAEALEGCSKELSRTLVNKVLKKLEPSSAKEFLRWAVQQEGYEHSNYLMNSIFQKFLYAQKFETALEVLEEMKENKVAIDYNSFVSLAFCYVKAGKMKEAKETINLVKSFGYRLKPRLYHVILNGYLQANDEEGAARLAQNLSEVADFNSALSVYARAGKAELALKMLESMKKSGCLANEQTYLLLVRSLCRGNMIEEALKLLETMQEQGVLPDHNVYNTLINHLSEQKRVDEALKLVSCMKDNGCQPNIETHNHLIQGYLNSEQIEEARLQLEKMKADGCTPTPETLKLFGTTYANPEEALKDILELPAESSEAVNDVTEQTSRYANPEEALKDILELPAESSEVVNDVTEQMSREKRQCSKCKSILEICDGKPWDADAEEALSGFSKELTPKLVHRLLQKMEADVARGFFTWAAKQKGYTHTKRDYSELFQNLLRAGKLNSAIEILKELADDKVLHPGAFALLMHFYGKAGMMTKAEEALELMKSLGSKPDAKLYGVLLNGYLQASDNESAVKLVQSFSDVEEFNAAISAYARAGKADPALKVLEIMEKNGCLANVQTSLLLVRCLCQANMAEEALTTLESMQEKGLDPDVQVYNTLISHFCQKKRVDEALKLVAKMKTAGCQPDIVTHNSLIKGYLKLREVEKAQQHVEEMKAEGCMPTDETSRLFIGNLCAAEEVEKALQEFKAAAEENVKPRPDACNSLLKGLIKEGKLEEALKVFERMKGACRADSSSYVVMLRGCCNFFRFDVMNQLLTDVRSENLQLPISTYVVLLQTYSRAKKFKEVVALFAEFQKRGQISGARTATAVLDALSRAHQLDLGAKLCENLAESGIEINERQLKYFARLLARNGRAGEAMELMKGLLEKGCVIPNTSKNAQLQIMG